MGRCAVVIAGVLAAAGVVSAGTMTTTTGDGRVQTQAGAAPVVDNVSGGESWRCDVGEYYSPGGANYVMPFQLPALGAGERFDSASLRVQIWQMNSYPAPADADLYGLGRRATDAILPGDYYQGETADSSDATLVQQSFLTHNSPVRTSQTQGPFVMSDAQGGSTLADYLNAQYANGAGAGQYVFLRLSPHLNTIPAGWNSYYILTADAGVAEEHPMISYTTAAVPEPAAVGTLVLSTGFCCEGAGFSGRKTARPIGQHWLRIVTNL